MAAFMQDARLRTCSHHPFSTQLSLSCADHTSLNKSVAVHQRDALRVTLWQARTCCYCRVGCHVHNALSYAAAALQVLRLSGMRQPKVMHAARKILPYHPQKAVEDQCVMQVPPCHHTAELARRPDVRRPSTWVEIRGQHLVRAACRNEDRLVAMLLEAPGLHVLLLLQHLAVLLRQVECLRRHTEVLGQACQQVLHCCDAT